jgi:hypothetical protein
MGPHCSSGTPIRWRKELQRQSEELNKIEGVHGAQLPAVSAVGWVGH